MHVVQGGPAATRLGLDDVAVPRRVGLGFPDQLPFATWKRIGRQLSLISDASTWWLGDWLVYGERRFADRYKRAVKETSLDYQTLRNYAWIARQFRMSRRRDKLSMSHHAEVAALTEPEQDMWLDRAEQLSWSRAELRRRLRASRRGMPDTITFEPLVQLRIQVSPDREQRWQAAADNLNYSLSDWMAMVLDGAAETVLDPPEAAAEAEAAAEPAGPTPPAATATELLIRTA